MKIRKFLLLLAFLALTGNLHAGIWDMFQSKPPFPEEVFTAMKAFAENNFCYPGDPRDTPRTEVITVTKMQCQRETFTTQHDIGDFPKGTVIYYIILTYMTHDTSGVNPDATRRATCSVKQDSSGEWRFQNLTAGDTAHNGIP